MLSRMWANNDYILLVKNLSEIRKLFYLREYDKCLQLINENIAVHEDCPDLWMVKAILLKSNPQTYNYCLIKAKSLLADKICLLTFKPEELKMMKFEMPDNWLLTH